ncbi:hypothetical protein BD311DRAFT_869059 [Dichomitus squalens]|uniref:Uncharacterized protein n=1 Tax=Dichomitus squalens TaxID=114155 RepID=A0A4Q9M7K6_9APHY|nr:hypothetical protein BD311DRAFT_869059 [Dichomitus squalens]
MPTARTHGTPSCSRAQRLLAALLLLSVASALTICANANAHTAAKPMRVMQRTSFSFDDPPPSEA